MTITLCNYRLRQFHRTSNRKNPSNSYRDTGSASLAAACLLRPWWQLWKAIWVFIQHFPISGIISRYREINFRYREMVDFPISGNDFRISGIDFPISGNVLDFPISENQFPISENRHPTEAGHSAILQHHPTTPPPINNGPQLYRPHLLADTVITTSVNRSRVHTPKLDQCNQQSYDNHIII